MAQFIKCMQNGSELDLDVESIDLVRAIAATGTAAQGAASKGYLEIFFANRPLPVILTANADINAFYAAFYPVAFPSAAVPTTSLGTTAAAT
jgi:hypothetical protein